MILHRMHDNKLLFVVLLLIAWAGPVLADGKMYPKGSFTTVQEPVAVPDQQALICYENGVQTLVIETRFIGPGKEFAWVVPLPALPEISAAEPSIFPTLRSIFRPVVIDDIARWWIAALIIAASTTPFVLRRYGWGLISIFLLLFVSSVLIPSLGTARGGANDSSQGTPPVTLHARQLIGDYDIATLSAEQPDALLDWLKENEFAYNDRDKSIIADYVREKWFFAAVKLNRESDSKDAASPHPLTFKFPTERPVYPLRLTGTHPGPCTIDLYIFGPGRAAVSIPELQVVQCGKTEACANVVEYDWWRKTDKASIAVVHSKLLPLVPKGAIATKISGTLASAHMSRDAVISWQPFQVVQHTFYTTGAARKIAFNFVIIFQCVVYLALLILVASKKTSLKKAAKVWLISLIATGFLASAGYAILPKTQIKSPEKAARSNWRSHTFHLRTRLIDRIETSNELSHTNLLRKHLDQIIHDPSAKPYLVKNNFTGELRREEESPGNYGFRQGKNGPEYLWYDQDGGEHRVIMREYRHWE